MNAPAYERLLDALTAAGKQVRTRGRDQAAAQCPAHEDSNPSLSVRRSTDGALVYCHSGCHNEAVVDALGLPMAALFDRYDPRRGVEYRYDNGRVAHRSYGPNGKKRFWQTGDKSKVELYHLGQLLTASEDGAVFLVEGEKDVHAIEAAGGVATTAPQGARNFAKVDVSPLAGRYVTAVVDRDASGEEWARQVAAKLAGVAAALRFVQAAAGKDAADHVAAGRGLGDFEVVEAPSLNGASATEDGEHAKAPANESWPNEEPAAEPLFVDVAAVLDGGLPAAPPPVLLRREDGHALFYAAKVNVLFGDPECGKTWIALAAIVEALRDGRRGAVVDLDHNGAPEILGRLVLLGARPEWLRDPSRFRLAEPEDEDRLILTVAALRAFRPAAALVDSLGEVLPLLGLSSSNPDDYTHAHRRVLTPLAAAGAAVIAIDHLPKADDARAHGQTGTMAKRRAVNGVSLRVTVHETFAPGRGGAASMSVEKDRAGGVRAHCPGTGKTSPAGRFVMTAHGDGTVDWKVTAPRLDQPAGDAPDADVAELDALDPPPKSQRDVQERMKWGGNRALNALRRWRELRGPSDGSAES